LDSDQVTIKITAMPPTVLITGGSGYLGQFLVDAFTRNYGWNVVYTYNTSTPPPFSTKPAAAFKVDFITGEGLDTCFAYFENDDNDDDDRYLDAVINCVAISQPVACEKDPERARSINIPTKLLEALKTYQGKVEQKAQEISTSLSLPPSPPLLIHLSTDQVYDGSKSFSKESENANPINQYGKSKLEAERIIQIQWPHHAILRSTLIYGKEPPAASVGRSLFLQFVDEQLCKREPTSFFSDEWRSAVYVGDIIQVCKLLILQAISSSLDRNKTIIPSTEEKLTDNMAGDPKEIAIEGERTGQKITGVFNMGGPERLSRVDIARLVAQVRGHDATCILEVPSASVARGVASPSDISMDVSKLESRLTAVLGSLRDGGSTSGGTGSGGGSIERFKFTKFTDALYEIFDNTLKNN
jgi:dTDP-4-dehydrorhamnose reductase